MFSREIDKFANRDSNFELLRIVAMLFVIVHHFVVHGLMRYPLDTTSFYVSQIFFPLGKIGYVAFICISMWFLVDSRFKLQRFIRLYIETIFYSLIIGICFICINQTSLDGWRWVSFFFPISGLAHNYISVYLAFYLLFPFLLIIYKKLNDKQLLYLVVVIGLLQITTTILFTLFSTYHPLPSGLLLFAFVFFLMGYLKRKQFKILDNKILLLIVLTLMWLIMYLLNTNIIPMPKSELAKNFIKCLYEGESTIIDLVAGISLFFLFKSNKVRKNKYINILAFPSLGILLLHDNDLFKWTFWDKVIHVTNFTNYGALLLIVIPAIAVGIYLVCGVIDLIRYYLLEQNIFKIQKLNQLCDKVNSFLTFENTDNK